MNSYPTTHDAAPVTPFSERIDIPPPPANLVRDVAFFNTEPPLPFDGFVPTRHLHQTGQSLVYEGTDSGKSVVAKINYREVQLTFGHMAKMGVSLKEAHDALRAKRSARIKDFQERRQSYQEHFGKERVPDESSELKTVTVQGATLEHILGVGCDNGQLMPANLDLSHTYELETLVRRQDYDPIFEDPERVTTATRYAELVWYNKAPENTKPLDIEDYITVTEALTQPSVAGMTLKEGYGILNTLIDVQDSVWLERIITKIIRNPRLATDVREFLYALDAYHVKTGGMSVDAIGIDNILFDSHGRCHMGDALETESTRMLPIAQLAVKHESQGELPTRWEANILLNMLNYTRGINALAIASESPVRVVLPIPQGADHRIVWGRTLALVEAGYDTDKVPHRIPEGYNLISLWGDELGNLQD